MGGVALVARAVPPGGGGVGGLDGELGVVKLDAVEAASGCEWPTEGVHAHSSTSKLSGRRTIP